MKLYFAPPSPFVRKVRVCLIETGQEADVELVDAIGTPIDASHMPTGHNPLGKIPCLLLDDGQALYDSRVITQYLDARAGGKLYPDDETLWTVMTLEAMADGVLDAAVLMVYEHRCRPQHLVSDTWVEGQRDKVNRALDAIEASWVDHLEGRLDMGVISVGIALEYVDFRHPDLDWRSGRDRLSEWQAEFSGRPSMTATQPW